MSDNEPTPTSPGGPEVVALADEPGRHARGRPLPRPPEADLTDVAYAPVADAPVPDEDDGYDDDASQRAPAKPQQPRHRSDVSSAVRPRTARDLAEPEPAPAPRPVRRNLEPDPPTRPSPAAHGLAALVGLVAGPVAGAALVLGQSRVLAARTDWDAGVDVPGIALVIMSSLVLAALVLLAVWTAAAPAAGGAAT
ncbi:MAG: hypothetical protein FWE61_05125, partial [Micrococcales bacterium]|nr:hypothetical protein [Micrococcales bacterium]